MARRKSESVLYAILTEGNALERFVAVDGADVAVPENWIRVREVEEDADGEHVVKPGWVTHDDGKTWEEAEPVEREPVDLQGKVDALAARVAELEASLGNANEGAK